jgi:hypothetical protein
LTTAFTERATAFDLDVHPIPEAIAGKVLATGASRFVGSHVLKGLMARENVEAACRDPGNFPRDFGGSCARETCAMPQGGGGRYRRDLPCRRQDFAWGHANQSRTAFREPTLALIEEARANGVKRFIHTSRTSAHVYQDAKLLRRESGQLDAWIDQL